MTPARAAPGEDAPPGAGLVFWFTGLSGSGKSSVADGAARRLRRDGYSVAVLDGDDVRRRVHPRLGFSKEDIKENNARIVELCRDTRHRHDAILVPIISPFAESRADARAKLAPGFFEVYLDADLDCVKARDTKGLYARAESNAIDNLIGVAPDVPYEPPERPDLVLRSGAEPVERSIADFHAFAAARLEKRTPALGPIS